MLDHYGERKGLNPVLLMHLRINLPFLNES